MSQIFLKKSDIFGCLYFGAGFACSNFGTVFASTWNLKYQSSTSTRFSRRGYMAQVVPSLMMTMALRHAFDIPGGEGRIQNVDESMCYMFNSAKRSWTVWANTSYQKIFKMIIWKGGVSVGGGICSECVGCLTYRHLKKNIFNKNEKSSNFFISAGPEAGLGLVFGPAPGRPRFLKNLELACR